MSVTTTSTTTSSTATSSSKPLWIIMGIVILAAVLYIVFKKPTVSKTDAQIQAKFDSLAKADSAKLDSIANYYSKKVDTLNQKIDSAYDQISDNNQKITDLEKAYKKQSQAIDSYDADQLQHVLSNY